MKKLFAIDHIMDTLTEVYKTHLFSQWNEQIDFSKIDKLIKNHKRRPCKMKHLLTQSPSQLTGVFIYTLICKERLQS